MKCSLFYLVEDFFNINDGQPQFCVVETLPEHLETSIFYAVLMSQVLSGGRVLSFSSALVSDTGRYTCVAVNAGGEQQREYDLRVYGEFLSIYIMFLYIKEHNP